MESTRGAIMWSILLLTGSMALGQAARPADEDLKPTVQRLVKQLDGPVSTREQAEKEALALGRGAGPALRGEKSHRRAEKQRLARIRQRLQSDYANWAFPTAAPTVRDGPPHVQGLW